MHESAFGTSRQFAATQHFGRFRSEPLYGSGFMSTRSGNATRLGGQQLFGGDAMCFFFSLIPATIWVVLGYFILFSCTKTQGAVKTFGHILAVWVFILAALFPVMGAFATLAGLCPIGAF